ncbi:MAG: 2-hydroxyacyl-CoA dehydratase [Agathobaculum sp.]|uniref:2-hydroxyacyl-CoA dehydratase n=1 Tax=Agathobaculum sp. TaxID=2048138 RepID=UPI0025C36683|nr:2-hydroxyacyl-CoA dehydratase [Agathobaculum sp.]MDY3712400.1 2-hydroxyacyl-CoA dehydratase [Agathobaculum sp.]
MQENINNTYERPQFTEAMRESYTILVPNMLPVQLGLICRLMKNYGYNMELLDTEGPHIAEQGLKNVHNDTCYPALLVIGQLIDAIESGKYDIHKIALILPQTGGGCRASNYIHLLRKALEQRGYGFIPVISLNFSGLEDNPGFVLTKKMLIQIAYALLIGDLIMMVANQCRPYECVPGSTDKAVGICMDAVAARFTGDRLVRYGEVKHLYRFVLEAFGKVRLDKTRSKKMVGIVGEIYVKFSPLGNNSLEKFLLAEGCEPVLPGLMDFCLYCIYNSVIDHDLYGRNAKTAILYKLVYQFVLGKQADIIRLMKKDGRFRPPMPFDEVRRKAQDIISPGVKMGEGWLLPAEMVELISEGVRNIVCTQPFGCLPNHIAGKGMIRKIREVYPEANIVAVDYDPGASKINQENRIKLMLSSAE